MRSTICRAVLCLLVALANVEGHAQQAPSTTSTASQNPSSRLMPGRLKWREFCTNFYPSAEAMEGKSGTTKLVFRITKTGDVTDIQVTESSGWEGLDHDAIKCISHWKYEPALVNGEPVDVTWHAEIAWRDDPATQLKRNHPAKPLDSSDAEACLSKYPKAAHDVGAEGTVVLKFTIDTFGRARMPVVTVSSGNAELDAAAVACLSLQAYEPAAKDGKTIESEYSRRVVWKLTDIAFRAIVLSRPSCWDFLSISAYPEMVETAKTELSYTVEDGEARNITVKTSSGYDSLDRASRRCVGAWRFQRVFRDGNPVAISDTATITWVNPRRK